MVLLRLLVGIFVFWEVGGVRERTTEIASPCHLVRLENHQVMSENRALTQGVTA